MHFYKTHEDGVHIYHNIIHTESVVVHAKEIANHYRLSDDDFFIVTTAAWFHDAGYFSGAPSGHESRGGEMAEAFLKENNITDDKIITAIKNCILATQFPQNPQNLLEQIVCDADLFHLGTDGFPERNKLMHKEAEISAGKEISKKDWRRSTIKLLESHHYFTDYCRNLLEEKKKQNLDKLKRKEAERKAAEHEDEFASHVKKQIEEVGKSNLPVNDLSKNGIHEETEKHPKNKKHELIDLVTEHIVDEDDDERNNISDASKASQPETKEKVKKKKRPERGIDTVFRITSNNNQKLSSQADSKAHIMIQVNSIIISVLISMLFRKLEEYRYLSVPAIMLLAVNVLTIIFSVLATRPQIPGGTFSKQDIDDKKVNLLFFGNFYKMTLEDYASGMLALMEEYDFLYMSLIRDVYFQGKVLGKKYQLLRISYNIFMFGLVLSVLAFIIAFIFFSGK